MRRALVAILVACCACSSSATPRPESTKAPVAVAEPEPMPAPEPAQAEPPKVQAAPAEPVTPPEPEPAPDLRPPLGANATSSLFVNLRAVRKGPFAEHARGLIAAFVLHPFAGGGIETARDVDLLLLASEDVRRVSGSFIIVRHSLGKNLESKVEAAFAEQGEDVTWSERDGWRVGDARPREGTDLDPRVVVLLDDAFAAYAPPASLGVLERERGRLRTFGRKEKKTAFSVEFDIPEGTTPPATPLPVRFSATSDTRANPTVRCRLTFASPDDARTFVDFWNGPVRERIQANVAVKIMFGSIFEDIVIRRSEQTVDLRVQLEKESANLLLAQLTRTMETYGRRRAPPAPVP